MNVSRYARDRVLWACTRGIDPAVVNSFRPWVFERLVASRSGGPADNSVDFGLAIAELLEGP